ncbi:MAG TPA: ArsR family transcriptional regulator [Ignavibacteria bacterium]|nr:transcriptional regulator [Bacteroidota bacterium]HRI84231.1 ArsR family transcriptional regulator [Ignavibacteria bacterium]HRJ99045.1 ArsR family transcriptional regulator [Ignavibacteria bacterium]
MPDKTEKYTKKQNLIALFGNALGNPVRVAILQQLLKQVHCYHGDMALELPIANSTLSQHLKVLKDSGLIKGEINLPKTKYCINRTNWKLAKGLFMNFFE